MDTNGINQLSLALAQRKANVRPSGLSPKNASFLQAMKIKMEAEEKAAGNDWDQRAERQKKWADLRQEMWMKQQIQQSLQERQPEIGPDGKPIPQTEGIPASFLLSILF